MVCLTFRDFVMTFRKYLYASSRRWWLRKGCRDGGEEPRHRVVGNPHDENRSQERLRAGNARPSGFRRSSALQFRSPLCQRRLGSDSESRTDSGPMAWLDYLRGWSKPTSVYPHKIKLSLLTHRYVCTEVPVTTTFTGPWPLVSIEGLYQFYTRSFHSLPMTRGCWRHSWTFCICGEGTSYYVIAWSNQSEVSEHVIRRVL